MKILISYFSGTGNTRAVAKRYQREFAPWECDLVEIGWDTQPPELAEYDVLGFGFPVHAFNAPEIFLRFIRRLPRMEKPCFLFQTSGEGLRLNDASSALPVDILREKGYDILTDRRFVMPYNIIRRHSDGMVKQMVLYMRRMVRQNAEDIRHGARDEVSCSLPARGVSALFRLEWWYAKHQRFSVERDRCVRCGLCAAACPMDNIRMEDGECQFGTDCALCMRCVLACPKNAVNIGMLNGWRVNGAYDLDGIADDAAIPFPYLNGTETGIYRLYTGYFAACDRVLAAQADPAEER